MFKKVIGQEVGDNERSVTSSEYDQPERSTPAPVATPVAQAPSPVAAATGATRNILSSDVEIKGAVKFANDLVVDGKIEGEINSAGNLTVGENARLKAEIHTGTVTVYGTVHGNITAATHIELKASSEVIGDIKAATLTIEAGAVFVGKSTVGAPTQQSSSSPASSSSASSSSASASASTPSAASNATPSASSAKQGNLLDTSSPSKSKGS